MEEVLRQSGLLENDYVKEWKSGGGRVMGYICTSTPTEMIEAAGLLPYRIRALGHSDTELADARLSRFNCSFCRSCLQLGLEGAFDFMDGIIETNGCDHLRGMIENWDYVKKFDFFHYLKVPHIVDADSRAYFREELVRCKQALEKAFDVTITDESLRERIAVQDRVRSKLRTIYEMREREASALTGAEAMSLFLVATSVRSDRLEQILDRVISERKDHRIEGARARLMLGGSATDEVEFVQEIEGLGAVVVTDGLCYGSRAFAPHAATGPDDDPYQVLSRNYFETLLCPRMFDDFKGRKEYFLRAAERAKIDGVVLVHNKFCDVHGVDNVALRMALEKAGVPVLQLEKEYGASADIGRMKTRVQAFLERIGGE